MAQVGTTNQSLPSCSAPQYLVEGEVKVLKGGAQKAGGLTARDVKRAR